MPKLILGDELRAKLKQPLGTFLKGPATETMARLKQRIKAEKPPLIICVGDVVSRNAKNAGINVDVSIVDHRIMRREAPTAETAHGTIFRATNPSGTIEVAAWQAVQEAIERKKATLIVEGEEDLLALPAILLVPDHSFVIYGQPKEGIVIVKATTDKKREIQSIIDSMEARNS
jgi:hypothetical protein